MSMNQQKIIKNKIFFSYFCQALNQTGIYWLEPEFAKPGELSDYAILIGRYTANWSKIEILSDSDFKTEYARCCKKANQPLSMPIAFTAVRDDIFSLTNDPIKVYLKENHLEKLLVASGHELGHIIYHCRNQSQSGTSALSEAKAFAFQMFWCNTISDLNIGNVGKQIRDYSIESLSRDRKDYNQLPHYIKEALEIIKKEIFIKKKNPRKFFWD